MARVISILEGSGTGGAFVDGTASPPADRLKLTNFVNPLKYNLELMLAGQFGVNRPGGGSEREMDGSAAGTFDLRPLMPVMVDNRNNQISGFTNANGAVLKAQFRFFLWASTTAITLTPAVYNISQSAAASITGAAALSASSNDDYSGANQQQTITLSLHNSLSYYKPQVVVAGTPAAGYVWRAYTLFDLYVLLP